jgi:hypothetical protein
MVITAALISLAVMATPAEPQTPPPDQVPAYTLSGVRRAAARTEPKPEEAEPSSTAVPSKPLTGSAERQRLTVETRTPQPASMPIPDDRFVTSSLAPMGSGWHQEFLDMTAPVYGSSPFDNMGNRERVTAVATSTAFGLAIDGVGRLVKHLRKAYREQKVNKVRREIDAETAEVERLYRAGLAGQTQAVTPSAVRKTARSPLAQVPSSS